MQNKASILLERVRKESKQINAKNPEWNKHIELRVKDKGTFSDESRTHQENGSNVFLIKIGMNRFFIDNNTGQIIDYYKPSIFSSWKKMINKMNKLLDEAVTSYFDKNVVNIGIRNKEALHLSWLS